MDTQRLILLFVFGFSVLMLWEAWQKDTRPKPALAAQQSVPAAQNAPSASKPSASAPAPAAPASPSEVPSSTAPVAKGETVRVRTDLFVAEIDTLGGTL